MNTTIRNRAAALGIATIAGLAGVGVAGGSALAATTSEESTNSGSATTAAAEPQSEGHPSNASAYADELVRAWGNGSDIEVKEHATQNVVDALSAHGDEHATRWHRITADGAAGSSYVVYRNKTTGELLTLRVNNEAAALGEDAAVHQIRFND